MSVIQKKHGDKSTYNGNDIAQEGKKLYICKFLGCRLLCSRDAVP